MARDARITLRAVEPEDLELLYLWENDRTTWQLSNTLVPFSRYQLKRYIEAEPGNIHAHQQLRMMIDFDGRARPDSGLDPVGGKRPATAEKRTVGSIDLFDYDPVHQRAGLGILVASPEDRRKGVATEAILQMTEYCRKTLFLHQLYCNIAASNEASALLFRKLGFETTGRKKDWLRTEDGWEDEVLMQMRLGE